MSDNKFAFVDEVEAFNTVISGEIIEPVVIECVKCHEKFILSPREIKFYKSHAYVLPKHCKQCMVNKHSGKEFVCVDCGKTYTLLNRELEFFEKNGLHTPKRCVECREFKRIENQRNGRK